MNRQEDECIWVRMDAWLQIGDETPIKVQTRKLCRDGILLEYTGRIGTSWVEVIFHNEGATGFAGRSRYAGTIVRRYTDGIWVRFTPNLRSASELLMRHGLSRSAPHSAQVHAQVL
jgi:hypothetical protein